jgi:hypothetical protein
MTSLRDTSAGYFICPVGINAFGIAYPVIQMILKHRLPIWIGRERWAGDHEACIELPKYIEPGQTLGERIGQPGPNNIRRSLFNDEMG